MFVFLGDCIILFCHGNTVGCHAFLFWKFIFFNNTSFSTLRSQNFHEVGEAIDNQADAALFNPAIGVAIVVYITLTSIVHDLLSFQNNAKESLFPTQQLKPKTYRRAYFVHRGTLGGS